MDSEVILQSQFVQLLTYRLSNNIGNIALRDASASKNENKWTGGSLTPTGATYSL
jgi:hypothetical protein